MYRRQIFNVIVILVLLVYGCGGPKKTTSPMESETVVPKTETETRNITPPADDSIRVVKEKLVETPVAKVPARKYFVIIGSFTIKANSERFEQQLRTQGFDPFILRNKAGFYRVAVFSYDLMSEARKKILEIRKSFPDHADVWLLISQ